MRQQDRRWAALVLVGSLGLVPLGCSDDDSTAQTSVDVTSTEATSTTAAPAATPLPTTEPPTTTTTTTTVSVPTPPPTTTTAPPLPNSTGEQIDWVAVAQDVLDRRWALFAAPDASLVATVAVPGSFSYQDLEEEVNNLVAQGLHLELDSTAVVRSADVLEIDDPQAPLRVRLDVRFDPPSGGRLVDSTGSVVEEIGTTPTSNRVSLTFVRASVSDPWLLIDEFGLAAEGG